MKILTRYVLKEILLPLFFGIFAFASMFLGAALIQLLRETEQFHLSLWSTFQLFSLMIPQNLMLGSTIAVLLAVLLGLGNLTGHSETIAMRAGGLSYFRLAAPGIIIGLLVSIGGIMLNEYVIPVSQRAQDRLRAKLINHESYLTIPNFNKVLFNGDVIQVIFAKQYDSRTVTLQRAVIQEITRGRLSRTIMADRMYWQNGTWVFQNTKVYQYSEKDFYPIEMKQAELHYQLGLNPGQIELANLPPEQLSMSELGAYIKGLPADKEKRNLVIELNSKFAMPFASFVFALLGTPLALKPQRRSNGANFGLCLIFVMIYYLVLAFGTWLGRAEYIPAYWGAWLANIVLAGYGVYNFCKVKS